MYALLHHAPDALIHWTYVWTVGWPHVTTDKLTAQKLDCVTIADKLFSRGRTNLLSMLQIASSSFCISVILPDNCMSTQGSHGKQLLISKNKSLFHAPRTVLLQLQMLKTTSQ